MEAKAYHRPDYLLDFPSIRFSLLAFSERLSMSLFNRVLCGRCWSDVSLPLFGPVRMLGESEGFLLSSAAFMGPFASSIMSFLGKSASPRRDKDVPDRSSTS